MKKKIKLKFVDFWEDFDPMQSLIYLILCDRYEVELSEKPDYVICSVWGNDFLNYDCIRICYTGENQCIDFNLYDYGIGFDKLEFGDRYLRFPYYAWSYWLWCSKGLENEKERQFEIEDLERKKFFCNFIYSNGEADPHREDLFNKINRYKRVDSAGRFKNNIGGPIKNKEEFQKNYKFSIACENSSYKGYTTEKILHAFLAKTIPIYWGDPDIATEFNPKAFINCHDYDSFESVVDRIKELDNDDELFMSMMREPVFCRPDTLKLFDEDIHSFLYDIFERPISTSYRRNMSYWGKRYERNVCYKRIVTKKEMLRGLLPAPVLKVVKMLRDNFK